MKPMVREHVRSILGIGERLPDGETGIRDIDNPCEEFEPGDPRELAECDTDGHYLCRECVHISAGAIRYRDSL